MVDAGAGLVSFDGDTDAEEDYVQMLNALM